MKSKILGALASFILPIALFIFSPYWSAYFSDKKELSYEVLSTRELTNLDSLDRTWPDIKISYGGIDVSTGSFLTLAIANTGKLPIKREDFDSPISIHISNSESVLSYKTVFSTPANLDVKLSKTQNGLAVSSLLLNPGDRFFIEIFSRSPVMISGVSSRIVGLPAITKAKPEPRSGFYVAISPIERSTKASRLPISHIPFWLTWAVTHILLVGTMLAIWACIRHSGVIAKVLLFLFAAVTYLLTMGGVSMCIAYFIDILDINKWVSMASMMLSTFMSVYISNFLRRKIFSVAVL
ncbi:hypothetical protein [Pseudomonas kilonensis]|uniref:Uncharacterized protein n=1 Tax=Pseudomonas kilonensis TaxID=132476 RepID=A0ABY0Y3C7_9PSED|nr:hypothetical protein [Pseudomonas kilonensis]SEC87210.1 hypothetical protein SAMN04490188_0210 [Pseudomonas kilonensis]